MCVTIKTWNEKMLTRRRFSFAIGALSLIPAVALADPKTLTAEETFLRMHADELILIDVRTPREWQESGIAEGAWPMDMREPDFGRWIVATLEQNPNHQVAIICRSGNRSGRLMDLFAQNSIEGVLDVTEGMLGGPRGKGWIPSGLPTVSAQTAFEAMPKDLTAK